MKRGSRVRTLGAILCVGALIVTAVLTATGRAGSVRTSAVIVASPHVLTVGSQAANQGFIKIKFINAGPSTVNHAVATITDGGNPLPLPASAFTAFTLPDGCSVTGDTTSIVTCNLGQVPPTGISPPTRVIRFNASVVATFTPRVAVTFDEGKGSQLPDTATDDDFPVSIVSGSDQSRTGQCSAAGGTLTALDGVQQTSITYGGLPASVAPCTPASAGVDADHQPSNVTHPFGEISFVDFLDGAGLATVNVYFLSPPKGITKKNLALYELPSYPLLTATDGGAAVPKCVSVNGTLQIPPNSHFLSCLVTVDTLSGGGLVATLKARGGNDGGWGGIG